MNDEYRKQLLEQREEIEMMLLMDEYMESEGERLLQEFEAAGLRGEVPDIPVDLDLKCKEIIHNSFAKQERKRTLSRITKYIGKVAVYILLFLGAASTLVMSVDALRIPILNLFLTYTQRETTISYYTNKEESVVYRDSILEEISDHLPEGYEGNIHEEQDGSMIAIYQNTLGNILLIEVLPSEGIMSIDTEDADVQDTKVNSYDALLINKDGLRIVWFNPEAEMTYSVFADNMDQAVFWKIVYTLAK